MASRQTKLLVLALGALLLALITALTLLRARSESGATRPTSAGDARRPAPDTPRGVMWDAWHAAMTNDRETVRAALHAPSDADRAAADALTELLIAEAAFARQLRHTWPLSPTSRDGAGTWFIEGGDAAVLTARRIHRPRRAQRHRADARRRSATHAHRRRVEDRHRRPRAAPG